MSHKNEHDYAMKGCICKKHSSPYYYAEITYKQVDGSVKRISRTTKCKRKYDAVKMEIIDMNPADAVKLTAKRKEKFSHAFYTIDQLMKLWQAAKGTLYEPAIVLASIYGLRRGEVSGLKWERVDFDHLRIRIEETIVYAGSKPYTKGTKTEASMRTMPIISPVKAYLQKIAEAQKEKTEQMGSAWLDSGYVVVDDFGAPLRPLRISNNFKRLLAENKLPHIRFHDLRHSVATYMLSMGVPIAEISAWLGHKSVSTTSNIYAHVTDDMRIATARWMDSGYNPNHNGDLKKVTLEEAIQKLFENVMDNGEVRQIEKEDKNVQAEHKTSKHGYDYQKYKNELERNNEQFEERSKFHVIRGKLA